MTDSCCVILALQSSPLSEVPFHARLFMDVFFQFVIKIILRKCNNRWRIGDCFASWRECVSEASLHRRFRVSGIGDWRSTVDPLRRLHENPSPYNRGRWRSPTFFILQSQCVYWLPSQLHLQQHRLQASFLGNRAIRHFHSTCR